jgi:serine/threonine protein kinase
MGEVYRARDTKLQRDVALKVLPEHFVTDPERLARFQREAQVLASLNHPNIAAIYGLEEADGVRALVLEFVEGPTLQERLRAHGSGLRELADPLAQGSRLRAQGTASSGLEPSALSHKPDAART